MKRILFSGDVVGKEGCEFFAQSVRRLKSEMTIDAVIVNGENSAAGNGITEYSSEMLLNAGADMITTGNHCFKQRNSVSIFEDSQFILRPANYPEGVTGRGYGILDFGSWQLAVVNLMGVVYMEPLDNPFTIVDEILKKIDTPNIFVDFHAEATAEKKCMGHYLTGRVTAVCGTHTHVQTSDEIILGGHTAYITDAGMTGAELSVLGVKTEIAVEKMRLHYPVRFMESKNPCFFNGLLIDFDEKSGKSYKVTRLILR